MTPNKEYPSDLENRSRSMLVTMFMEEGSNMVERLTMTFRGVFEAKIKQRRAYVFILINLKKNDWKDQEDVMDYV